MQNKDYWEQRFIQVTLEQEKQAIKVIKEVELYYNEALDEIERDLTKWYVRYMNAEGIVDIHEAKKNLSKSELSMFKQNVEQYIELGEKNAMHGGYMNILEAASARVHISRLDAIKLQIKNHLELMTAKSEIKIKDLLTNIYTDGYYKTAYEIDKGLNVVVNFDKLDLNKVNKIISRPWNGFNFSDRVWNSKDKLVSTLHKKLTQNVIVGTPVKNIVKDIRHEFGVSKNAAERLVLTEQAYFSNLSRKDCLLDLGCERYQIVATLDSRTSRICQDMDNQIIEASDAKVGETLPPFHPRCRSTFVPYYKNLQAERFARNKNGADLVDNMNYAEWKQKYIEKA